MAERKFMPRNEIFDLLKKGHKDFSNIICKQSDFASLDLSKCNFENSDLSYSSFDGSDLTGANFSGCNLDWTSFEFANLTRTDFHKASIKYSVLNNAIIDKTDFSDADLEWSLVFDANLHAANLKGAHTATLATHISQVTEEGLAHVQQMLGQHKTNLALSTVLAIRFSIDNTQGLFERDSGITQATTRYKPAEATHTFGYGGKTLNQENSGVGAYGTQSSYKDSANYSAEVPYEKNQFPANSAPDKKKHEYKK